MNRRIRFATELKAPAGSEPTRDTQDELYHYSCHEQIERRKLLGMAVEHHVFDVHLDAMRKVVS